MKFVNTKTSWREHVDEGFSKGKPSKKLIKRQAEEQEAQEEINEYCTNERNPDRLDGLGSKRRERGKGELC